MSLRQIAENLGLSVTTVSRALGNHLDVSAATRQRVQEEAQRLGYVPNATARRLQKGRADAFGVIVSSNPGAIGDAHLHEAFLGAWSRLSELGLDLVMLPGQVCSNAAVGGPWRDTLRRAVEERRVDGILLIRPRRDDPHIDGLLQSQMPFVMLGGEMSHRSDLVTIGSDQRVAADLICGRLSTLGHGAFTCVLPAGTYDYLLTRRERLTEAAAAHGLAMASVVAPHDEEGARAVTAEMLRAEDGPPTALVYLCGRMVLGGQAALAQSPWIIGRHVSVITWGDDPALTCTLPPLTAVRTPTHDMARHAVDVLIAMRDGQEIAPIRAWPPELVIRRSDGPPFDPPR